MNENKRLVWLEINASYSHSSLALPAIEACRCGDSYSWCRVSGTINSDIFSLTRELYEAQPDVVAATLWLFNHEIVVKICDRIKTLLPNVVIILGGPEFNGDNEEFLRRNTSINLVFRGEGEREFHKFLRGDDFSSIPGLCYLNDGVYQDNGTAKVADFAALPSPESSEFFCYTSPFVQIETSRGCFNSCAFCVSGGDKPIRNRSLEDVEKRISIVRNHGIHDVRILDRTFNYSIRRARELLTMFQNFPDMNFHLEIHPALLTDELCDLLRSMPKGLLHLEAGIQSLDDRVIEACNRVGSNEKAIEGLSKLCEMANFETHTDLIAGLPHYTLLQIFSDVRQLSQLKAGEIQLELLKLLPGTKMRREAINLGIKFNPNPPYEVMETPAISLRELDRARLLSKLIDKFYNSAAWQNLTRQLINDSSEFLPNFLDYLASTELLEKPIGVAKCGELLYDFCTTWKEGNYLDLISLTWIENGLSHRCIQAGDIKKATTLPDSITRQHNVHYYLWQGRAKQYIICFDRSKEHSRPVAKYEL